MSHAPSAYTLQVDVPATLAGNQAAFGDGDSAYVTSLGYSFRYSSSSTALVDNVNVIDGGPTHSGRWIRTGIESSVQEIRFPIALTTVSSTTAPPAGARVVSTQIILVTPYSVGATITVGQAGSASAFMQAADNIPQGSAGDVYESVQDTAVSASFLPIVVTVAGAPAAGAATCVVKYSTPTI